jgi:methionyl-tRNA formyltransferase
MVNLHFSLLPRWRGAAPVERAILAGDRVTGVCLMALEEGLDTGGVYRRHVCPLDEEITAEQLRGQLAAAGTDLLLRALEDGLSQPEQQPDEGITYAAKLTVADRELDFQGPAVQAHRVVRVGGAWTTFRGARLKVHAVERPDGPHDLETPVAEIGPGMLVRCGDGGVIRLCAVQPDGRPAMAADAWAHGADPVGERLGS